MLGMRCQQHDDGSILLSQKAYMIRVLARFGMSDCNANATPLPVGLLLTDADRPQNESERKQMVGVPYREALGSIMWGQIAT